MFFNNLPGRSLPDLHNNAELCSTDSRKIHASHLSALEHVVIERNGRRQHITGELVVSMDPANLPYSSAQEDRQGLDVELARALARELDLKLGNYDHPEVTRKVVLKMNFDGKDTVWCPIGDFFGSGIGLNPPKFRFGQMPSKYT